MASIALTPGFLPEPSAELRPLRLRMLDELLERSWRRGWSSRPSLDPDHLVARAREATGHAAAGTESGWPARLDRLTHALEAEAALSPLGRAIAHGQLVAALADLHRAHALWRRHPAILDRPIPAPVIVLGQMRSGTTRMQRLLACDPRLDHTRFFESWNPLPRGAIDDRRLRAAVALGWARWLCPEFGAIHPTGVAQPDEEIGLHSVSIFGSAFETQWRVPGFAAMNEAIDPQPVYAEFRRLLQTIAWLRGDGSPRPWILKVPQMTQDLDAVLRVFPDSRLIRVRRDPVAVVASAASLAHSQMRLQSAEADPHWIGREWLRKVAVRDRRTTAALAATDRPMVEVQYAAMSRDWRGEMARVYAMLGLPLTAEVEARMARYQSAPRHRRLNRHRPDLADYGLTAEEVRRTL